MDIVRQLLLVIHLLGFAALFGGLLVQARSAEKSVNDLMRDGAGTAFLAGLLLVGVIEMGDYDYSDTFHMKVGVKLVVGLAILGLVMANLRKPRIPLGLYWGLLGLTVVNVLVAVMWSSAHA